MIKITKSKFVLVLTLMIMLSLISVANAEQIKNPETFITATNNSVETLDLHFMTSSATTELSLNVYDSLLSRKQKGEDELIPSLSTKVPSKENGLIKINDEGKTIIKFPIRKGVKFHNGDLLTPEDVIYTFKRAMVIGGLNSLTRSLLSSSFKDLIEEIGLEKAYEKMDKSITTDGDNVVFTLPKPFAPFLDMLADDGASSGIINKSWAIAQGAWPGTKDSINDYLNLSLEDDPLNDKMIGTGPFKLSNWKPGERIVLERFDDYWRGPAKINRVIRKIVTDKNTQILLLKNGDVDFVSIGVADLSRVEGYEGIKVRKNIPQAWLFKINFNFDIKSDKYLGSGKLGPDGIPSNFFSDINVRKAFQYTFDWETFIDDVMLGAAIKPYGPVCKGLPTADSDIPQYYNDLDKAEKYFKKAWDGQVWEKGFELHVPYSAGSTGRQRALEIIKANLKKINPKFKLKVSSLPWAAYVGAINDSKLPMTIFGIIPPIKHPHFALSYHMHSDDFYAQKHGYTDLAAKKYDDLIDELSKTYDEKRMKELSSKLQYMSYEDSLAIMEYQVVSQVAMREWVYGYKPDSLSIVTDFYSIYKK